jgi:hypothetical protein
MSITKKPTTIAIMLLILSLLVKIPRKVRAFDEIDPQKINKFGIHLADTNNVKYAAALVNSSGGDWGWVTVVLRSDEHNPKQWQDFFDRLREEHLIPIVRLATQVDNGVWKRPTKTDIDRSVNFLSRLNWPVRDKFIIIFNEPNQGKEWGGRVDPESYANIFLYACQNFKKKTNNFFILLAGADQAAPQQPPKFQSAKLFYRELIRFQPKILSCLDGLASHSYPNHGFVGTPSDRGWGSIRGYQEEIKLLRSLGLKRKIPIFITETGWPHKEGEEKKPNYYSANFLNKYFEQAFSLWNSDKNIYSFTPFLLYFNEGDFSHFSWLDKNKQPYSFYLFTQKIPKQSWTPPRVNKGVIVWVQLPSIIFPEVEYRGLVEIKNEGQVIWKGAPLCWESKKQGNIEVSSLCSTGKQKIHPGEKELFKFSFKVPKVEQGGEKETKIFWDHVGEIKIKRIINQANLTLPNTLGRLKNTLLYLYNAIATTLSSH